MYLFFTYGYDCIIALEGSNSLHVNAAPKRKSVISSSAFSNSFMVSLSSSSSSRSLPRELTLSTGSWTGVGEALWCVHPWIRSTTLRTWCFLPQIFKCLPWDLFSLAFLTGLSPDCLSVVILWSNQFILQVFKKYVSVGRCIFYTCSSRFSKSGL